MPITYSAQSNSNLGIINLRVYIRLLDHSLYARIYILTITVIRHTSNLHYSGMGFFRFLTEIRFFLGHLQIRFNIFRGGGGGGHATLQQIYGLSDSQSFSYMIFICYG